MQNQIAIIDLWILIDVIDTLRVKEGATALDAVYHIAFSSSNSARYDPSWPVIPVISATFCVNGRALLGKRKFYH